jgi:outer membrane receptor protein involved in Fe transport
MNYSSAQFHKKFMTAILCSVLMVVVLNAGQTGKIVGKIIDKRTNEPIIGASVVLQGTKQGSSTDFEGEYFIGNVQPGTYSVTVTTLGYKTATIRNIIVKIDLTTTIDVKMEETVVEMGDAVIIEAERPLVQKDLTSSAVSISADEMRVMPVENISQVINLQAGVVGGHFRGGRDGEVAYLVDGIPVNNPLNGGAGFIPENSSVREMEVISGTFNAEYGQAMSGVVNIVTQDGSPEYHGSVGGYFGDHYTTHTDLFYEQDKFNLFNDKNYTFSLSGPAPLVPDLFFFMTGRMQDENGWLYGKRLYTIHDANPLKFTLPDGNVLVLHTFSGNGVGVPMNPYYKISLNGKLSYSFGDLKVSYSSFWEKSNRKDYDHGYRLSVDGTMNHYFENLIHNVQFSHIISQYTMQSLKFSYNRYTGKGYLFEDPYSPLYLDPDHGSVDGPSYRNGGTQGGRYENKTNTLIGQWTLSSQISKEHKIGIGAEFRTHALYDFGTSLSKDTIVVQDSLNNEIDVYFPTYPGKDALGTNTFNKFPIEGSVYVQDKMEYGLMIVNAGIRLDYFDPNTKYLYDLKNPRKNPLFVNAGRLRSAKQKFQLSPRLGMSFPITDQGIIHFSYGHFFQIPTFSNLYQNPEYKVNPNQQLASTTGNPDLEAQKTVSYELGLQQVLFTNIGVDFTVYYRDIRNLLGTEIVQSYEGFKYGRFVNRDYGNTRGFILSVERRFEDFYSIRADYTFQIAEGNASDALSVYYNNQSTPPIETNKKVVPLNWDQRSTLNVSVNVGDKGNWMSGLIINYGNGFPYTEDEVTSNTVRFENGGTKPWTVNADLRLDKNFTLFDLRVNAYMIVYNVFDIMNDVNVDGRTGVANKRYFTQAEGYDPDPIYGYNTYQEYQNNPGNISAPRNIRIGFNLDF